MATEPTVTARMGMGPAPSSLATAPRGLEDLLGPLAVDDFLQRYLGKDFLYAAGAPGRFRSLFDWPEINSILRHHRLETPRLRLVQGGQAVPASSFLDHRTTRRSERIPRLRSADLTRHLREGATLILDAVDEIHEPLTTLAESLEAQFCNRIQMNMYAGWRSSPGFDIHWDGHDVLVLQISGRKLWKIYPMTREHPLLDESEAPPPASQSPLWEGTLRDGDVLYIPRGWWHVAVPLDEPTLHLTIGLHNNNGADLLTWFANRLRSDSLVRQDLPRFGSPSDRVEYLERMKALWAAAWTPALLDEYFAETDARAAARPHFGLPWTATPSVLSPQGDEARYRWTPVRMTQTFTANSIKIECHNGKWNFALAAAPILTMLQDREAHSLSELSAAAPALAAETVRLFVKELADAGLIEHANG